jgi:hypothetical protein
LRSSASPALDLAAPNGYFRSGGENIKQRAKTSVRRGIGERGDQQQSRFRPFEVTSEDHAGVFEVASATATAAIDGLDTASRASRGHDDRTVFMAVGRRSLDPSLSKLGLSGNEFNFNEY